MPFTPVKKQKVSEQVAGAIREAIVTGRMQPDEALPSERELAERFKVNRSSIREALHRLEAWGLVEIRQGNATTVRNFLLTAGPDLLPFCLAPAGRPDPVIIGDLMEIRGLLLTWTARQAARRCADADLTRLRGVVEALEASDLSPDRAQLLDFDFFQELVHLAGNRVLALFTNAVRQVYLERPELFRSLYEAGSFDPGAHRTTLEAIVAGDPDRAATAMEQHAARGRRRMGAAASAAAEGSEP